MSEKFDPATQWPDDVRWFEPFKQCRQCAKVAHGVLRGSRNDDYGAYCRSCANRRLKTAKAEQEAARAYNASVKATP